MRVIVMLLVAMLGAMASGDTITISISEDVESRMPVSGRVIVYMIDESSRRGRRRMPASAPFYDDPQPITSIAVESIGPGDTVTIDGAAFAFPASIDTLDGRYRLQAALDQDSTERSVLDGPGNLLSAPVSATFDAEADDAITITLDQVRPGYVFDGEHPNLEIVELRSELLSEFYGRDVFHRAGVALPKAWQDPDNGRTEWGAIYVVPGFGGRHDEAFAYADMFETPGTEHIAPVAVYIVLDPESPLGHHGFVDSPNHGPRGTALVTELIPHLEEKYRLASRPEGRIVTGHSSGGWSSLWLQLQWPDVFGACWSSAPDPIDFTAFQMADLYSEKNLFTDDAGNEVPSYRRVVGLDDHDEIEMTVRQETRMEYAIHPDGGSGEQWDTWEAMFSPRSDATGLPVPMFDARTGVVDRAVVEAWKPYDISRLVLGDWDRYGPIVMERVRLACGTFDDYYLHRAVGRFKGQVERCADEHGGWRGDGYIKLVPEATHGNLTRYIFRDKNEEMRAYLINHGLMD